MKILIADDIEQNRYMLEALLKGHGHEVIAVANGEEALKIARTDKPDLIVTDVLMPVMDGFMLCRHVKNDPLLSQIAFIFYTATYTDPKDADFGLSLGADQFLIKPMDPDDLMAAIEATVGPKAQDMETLGRTPVESTFLQEYNQTLIRKLEDKMIQLEESNQLLKAEVEVRRLAETKSRRFETAIENTDDAIILINAQGMVDYVNPSFEKITGFSEKEVLGREPSILKTGFHPTDFYKSLWNTILSGRTWRGRLMSRTKTDQLVEMETAISPIPDDGGRGGGFVAVMRDVTQQVALEKKLAQAQKMEAVGTLAGGIAHDFNNILGAITGYSELALLDAPGDCRAADRLHAILNACHRAKNLVQQILTFSRKAEWERAVVDLAPLISESQQFLRASIPTTIEIRVNLDDHPCYVLADPIHVQQVILNLGANAVHAMRDGGGVLDIRLRRLEMEAAYARQNPNIKPGPYLLLSVSDSGCGMDKDTMDRIFDPFFTTKDRGEGTGLGLSVVHGIVQSHEGTITVYSELGRGTTFNVYFPEVEGEPRMDAAVDESLLPRGCERVLFVDDEKDLVEVGRELLETLGYQVATARSSRDALERFAASPESFDLIITDQTMPQMTGTRLAQEIRKLNPDIPVLICTGFGALSSKEEAQAGKAVFMSKPLEFRKFAQTVRALLDN